MVLDADRATRGFLTTTGIFPPDILEDPFIAPRLGSTLELVVSIPVTPSFEPRAGTVGAETKVTPRRSVLD
jgi:hypothetical protein